jgi:hypothetical protein
MPAGETIMGLAKKYGGCYARFVTPINMLNCPAS